MATPQALTAVIRASRPEFRSTADKAVFAVHAILSVNGFSLRKVGDGVDEAAALGASSLPAEEVDMAGWNRPDEGDGSTYAFLYVPEPGAQRQQQQQQAPAPPPLLLLKCLRLAADSGGSGQLLVSLADTASGRSPATLELHLDRYVPTLAPGAAGYENLDELIRRVQGATDEALEGQQPAAKATASGSRTAAAVASTSAPSGHVQEEQQPLEREEEERRRREREARERELRDPLRDDRYRPGMGPRGPPGWGPMGVGDEDLMPGGLPRPPGMGPGGLGGVPLGPRGQGGGMMVGPENPIFADRLRHPRGGPGPGFAPGPGNGVPGMRWDPINPEGLQGWSPDDYTRDGRAMRNEGLNDIGRPPPGRGPDWDNMFG